jgi:hypothetical protein
MCVALSMLSHATHTHTSGSNCPRPKTPNPKNRKTFKGIHSLPSLDEIERYCAARGLPESDTKWLHDHWMGNGFKEKGQPIVDWQAVLRNWQASRYLPSQKQSCSPPKAKSCLG